MDKKNFPVGVMFHHFHGAGHPAGQGSLSAEQFEALIEDLGRDRFLDPDEWSARATSGTLEAHHLCLTFDDNLLCQYDVALPVLEKLDMRGFWFAYTSMFDGVAERLEVYRYFRSTAFEDIDDFYGAFFRFVATDRAGEKVAAALADFDPKTYNPEYTFYTDNDRKFRFVRDRVLGQAEYNRVMDGMIAARGGDIDDIAKRLWMDRAQLRALAEAGHAVGLHSHSHPTKMAELDPARQASEYRTNFDALREITGVTPVTASHPCGSYSPGTLDILRDLGIGVAFRDNPVLGIEASVLEMPRQDHTLARATLIP